MKKAIVFLGIIALILCMVSCAKDTDTDQSTASGGSTGTKTVFEQFEAGLQGKDISYEKVAMAADLVGAKEGVKYKIGEGSVELYVFDETSEAYKTANTKQALSMEGFGEFSAKVANGKALLVSGLDSAVYEVIFDSLT